MTAWKNGAYDKPNTDWGLRVEPHDRKKYFKKEWPHIFLTLEGRFDPIQVNIDKDSFWEGACRELINKEIGKWLRTNGLTPWPWRKPPKLCLEPISGNMFRLHK